MNLKISSALYVCLTVSIITLFPPANTAKAQTHPDAVVAINPKTLKLKDVFAQLSEKAGLNFIYADIDNELEKTITLTPAVSSVSNILEQLSTKTGLRFSATGDDIAVRLQKKGIIKGHVKTSQGQPAAYVTVKIKGSRTTETDEEGVFLFKNVIVGNYTISASHVGHAAQNRQVSVNSDETTVVNFTLSANTTDLDEISVNGNKTNKFTRKQSDFVAKTSLKALENPQVYSSVTKELIKDQLVVTYSDVIKNVAGVSLQLPNQQGELGGAMSSRGFITSAKLRNGLPGMSVGMLDPVNIETLEAIKGPSGALFGSALTSFGGLFNLVTKKPQENTQGEISYSTGSFGLSRITADINTPLNAEKTLLFRLTGAKHKEESFQDAGLRSYTFVAPSLTYLVNDRLSFNLDGEFNSGKYNDVYRLFPDNSFETGAHRPKDIAIDYNRKWMGDDLTYQGNSSNFYAQANYKISDTWKSQTNFSYSHYLETGPWSWMAMLPGNKELRLNTIQTEYLNNNLIDVQQNFTGEVKVANLRNRLLFGLDYFKNNTKNSYAFIESDPLNAANPGIDYNKLTRPRLEALAADSLFDKSKDGRIVYSAYVQDVIDITSNLNLLLSLRLDRNENQGVYNIASGNTSGNFNQTALSPKFGLVYQPVNDKVALFANYMNGFSNVAPQRQPDGNVSVFKPQEANQYEAGVKLDLFSGRLTSTVSYYNIKVNNSVLSDPQRPQFTIQNGTQRSRGFEADIKLNPFEGLDIIAGYSYNENKFIKSDAYNVGLRPGEAGPKNLANAWISYTIKQGYLKGAGAGFGGNYASENIIENTTSSYFVLPAYTVVNATLFYDQPAYRLGLKANNLADKRYFTGWAAIVPQMPRSFIIDFTLKFGSVR